MKISDINDFKQGKNVIKVSNPIEMSKFRKLLHNEGMKDELKWFKTHCPDWPDLVRLGQLNNKHDIYTFLFEYTPGKGLTWTDDIAKSTEWFGKKPIEL